MSDVLAQLKLRLNSDTPFSLYKIKTIVGDTK